MWHVPIFELAIRKLQEVFSSSTLVIELYLKINCWTLPTHSCSPRKRASSYLSFKKPHKSTCMIDLQIFEWRKDKCQVTHNNCPWLIHFIPDHVQFPSFFLGLGFHESRITGSTSSIQLSMEMHEPSKFIIVALIYLHILLTCEACTEQITFGLRRRCLPCHHPQNMNLITQLTFCHSSYDCI